MDNSKIIHNNYEKITDDIIWFSSKWLLKFTVILNKNTDKFGKVNYHKEIGYYRENKYCINISRSFDSFLSIESARRDEYGNKESVIIKSDDLPVLKYRLSEVARWFMDEKYKNLFIRKNGKIIIPTKVEPVKVEGLVFDKYIEFEPWVYTMDNQDQLIGVMMYINNDNNSVFLNINKVLGFNDFIQNFNMYQSSQLMLNYIGRPENGTNMFNMENKSSTNVNHGSGGFLS